MIPNVDLFDKDQKELLRLIIDDFDRPAMSPRLLAILAEAIDELDPEGTHKFDPDLKREIDVCRALQHWRIENLESEAAE